MKKAQGLSINTIIIVALALVVLVVILAVFMGRFTIFGWGLSDCEETYQGNCRDECTSELETNQPLGKCVENGEVTKEKCCVSISSGDSGSSDDSEDEDPEDEDPPE